MQLKLNALASMVAVTAAAAAPATLDVRQNSYPSCTDYAAYSIAAEATHWSPVAVADGQSCTSSKTESCTVGAMYSTAFSITVEVGTKLDFGDIFGVDSSISYTTTTTTGYTTGETCPAGNPAYVCGLTYTNNLVDVIGNKTTYYQGDCVLHGQVESVEPFLFTAPVTVGPNAQVTYAACIDARSPNQDLDAVGIPACPDGF